VIASYHLGPMDLPETRAYIEHRLTTVGWHGDPAFDDGAHAAIFGYTGGIPRKVNTLLDRVLLMGYLEEMHTFTEADIQTVIADISEEFQAPDVIGTPAPARAPPAARPAPAAALQQHMVDLNEGPPTITPASVEVLDERMMRLEKSIVSVLSILKKIVVTPPITQPVDNQE
jgi:general secretion pathway protein A